jgi:hypothetical protein
LRSVDPESQKSLSTTTSSIAKNANTCVETTKASTKNETNYVTPKKLEEPSVVEKSPAPLIATLLTTASLTSIKDTPQLNHAQLINLNKTDATVSSSSRSKPTIVTAINLNMLASHSSQSQLNAVPILATTKLSSANSSSSANNKIILSSNLLTPIQTTTSSSSSLIPLPTSTSSSVFEKKQPKPCENVIEKKEEVNEVEMCQAEGDEDSSTSTFLDDSLTSLQWLQNLNIMKSASAGETATEQAVKLSPNGARKRRSSETENHGNPVSNHITHQTNQQVCLISSFFIIQKKKRFLF